MKIKEFRELLKDPEKKDIALKELNDCFIKSENPSKEFPNETYDFNYKTVLSILEENNLYKKKRTRKTNSETEKIEETKEIEKPKFSISDRSNDELMNRTFSIEKGTYERLQKFLNDNKKSYSLQGYAFSELLERGMDFFKETNKEDK